MRPAIDFQRGDILKFDSDDGPDQIGTVQRIENRKTRGVPVPPLPQRNATLREVRKRGGQVRDESDDPSTGGSIKWTGDAAAYLQERRSTFADAAGMEMVIRRSLIVVTARGNIKIALEDG